MRLIADKADNTAGATGELTAAEYNDHKNELQESVDRSGQTVSDTKTPDQLGRAMYINGVAAQSMIDSGSANAIQLTPVTGIDGLIFPETLAQLSGAVLSFAKSVANTSGTITVNVGQDTGSLLPAKSLKLVDGSDPEIGTITGECSIRYSLGNDRWELLSQGVFRASVGSQLLADQQWDSVTDFSAAGTIVSRYGLVAVSTGEAGNTNKDPASPLNRDYWFFPPALQTLINMDGRVVDGGMLGVNDLGAGVYSTSMLIAKALLGATTYEFYRVALDGSTVTGDGTLEGIFDPGGANEYRYIDYYAPDDGGTRTVVDMRGRTTRSMTSGGGEADTLGEVQDDAMQRITGTFEPWQVAGNANASGVFSETEVADSRPAAGAGTIPRIAFDNAASVAPNAAKTNDVETRMANLVEGIKYIIVMKAA